MQPPPHDAEDPGWRRSARQALTGLGPGVLAARARRAGEGQGLVIVRTVFLSFVTALALIGVVVIVLELNATGFGAVPESTVAILVSAVGVASLGMPSLVARPLPCDDDERLAAGYVQRFFLRIAVAESAALAGFAGFLVSSAGWMYAVGAAFSAIGFVRLAPTGEHLRRDQDALWAAGCSRSLVAALQQYRPGRRA